MFRICSYIQETYILGRELKVSFFILLVIEKQNNNCK